MGNVSGSSVVPRSPELDTRKLPVANNGNVLGVVRRQRQQTGRLKIYPSEMHEWQVSGGVLWKPAIRNVPSAVSLPYWMPTKLTTI